MAKVLAAQSVDYNSVTTQIEIRGPRLGANSQTVRELSMALNDGVYVVEPGRVSGWGTHNAIVRRHPDVWGELWDVPLGDYLVTIG